MKKYLILILTAAAITASAQPQLLTTNWSGGFANNGVVPDNDLSGLTITEMLTGWSGPVSNVSVTLNLTGGWNGDIYAYLYHDGVMSMLLNQVGTPANSGLGYGDSGFNVTLSDSASSSIHNYQADSPTITDGVVQGYAYNGTLAPPFTTFAGMYDRWYAFGPGSEWELPARWRTPPAGLDLSTPLDFCSTADTYGGNSGSPAVTKDLALVGLNFDRNIEALGRDFIYLPEQGRNVMVDVRAIQAALDKVYGAHRILQELRTGQLVRSEQEADAGH